MWNYERSESSVMGLKKQYGRQDGCLSRLEWALEQSIGSAIESCCLRKYIWISDKTEVGYCLKVLIFVETAIKIKYSASI